MDRKTVCQTHQVAHDSDAGCPYCEPTAKVHVVAPTFNAESKMELRPLTIVGAQFLISDYGPPFTMMLPSATYVDCRVDVRFGPVRQIFERPCVVYGVVVQFCEADVLRHYHRNTHWEDHGPPKDGKRAPMIVRGDDELNGKR